VKKQTVEMTNSAQKSTSNEEIAFGRISLAFGSQHKKAIEPEALLKRVNSFEPENPYKAGNSY